MQLSEPGQNEEEEEEDAMDGGYQGSKSIESMIYQRFERFISYHSIIIDFPCLFLWFCVIFCL